MSYKEAFPNFPDDVFNTAINSLQGFKDSSDPLDASPSLIKQLPYGHYIKLYVDYPNQEDRQETCCVTQYAIELYDKDENCLDYIETNSLQIVKDTINNFIKRYGIPSEILGWPIDKPLEDFESIVQGLLLDGERSRANAVQYLIERLNIAERR